jgi:predicted nucleic acid-binding protein
VGHHVDLPLGFADAAVIACAESKGGRVLTLDRRHFDVVRA